jgi:hypothetical protein
MAFYITNTTDGLYFKDPEKVKVLDPLPTGNYYWGAKEFAREYDTEAEAQNIIDIKTEFWEITMESSRKLTIVSDGS